MPNPNKPVLECSDGRDHRQGRRPGHHPGRDPGRRQRLPGPVRRDDGLGLDPRGGRLHGRAADSPRNTILENNMVQTAASAGEAIAAGAIFTLPALIILGDWTGFDYWRHAHRRLGRHARRALHHSAAARPHRRRQAAVPRGHRHRRGPSQRQRGGEGLWTIVSSGLAGGLFKIVAESSACGNGPHGQRQARPLGLLRRLRTRPCLLAVGFIVGLNIAILMFLGGAANWLVAIPIYSLPDAPGRQDRAASGRRRSGRTRPATSASARCSSAGCGPSSNAQDPLKGVTSGLAAYRLSRRRPGQGVPRTERDLPMKWMHALHGLSVVPLFFVYQAFVGSRRSPSSWPCSCSSRDSPSRQWRGTWPVWSARATTRSPA